MEKSITLATAVLLVLVRKVGARAHYTPPETNLALSPTEAPSIHSPADTVWDHLGFFDIRAFDSGDDVGRALALSRNGLVVAVSGGRKVEVYGYERYGWSLKGSILGVDPGFSVAMDATGETLIIGSPGQRNWWEEEMEGLPGHATVWRRNPETKQYDPLGSEITNGVADDEFGYSVDMNSAGNIVVIGSGKSCGIRVLRIDEGDWRDFGPSLKCGNPWKNSFGNTAKLSADGLVLVVGEPFDNSLERSQLHFGRPPENTQETADGPHQGLLRTFRYDGDGWVTFGLPLEGYFATPLSLDLSDDGAILAIGTPLSSEEDPSTLGSCRVFKFSRILARWTPLGQQLFGEAPNDFLGTAVALSDDGQTLAVSALEDQKKRGFVSVYHIGEEQIWHPVGMKLRGPFALSSFGASLSLSSDGEIVAVGSPTWENGDGRGSVQVFETGVKALSSEEVTAILEINSPVDVIVPNVYVEQAMVKWVIERIDVDEGIVRPFIDQLDDDFFASTVLTGVSVNGTLAVPLNLAQNGVYLLFIENAERWVFDAFNVSWQVRYVGNNQTLFESGTHFLEHGDHRSNLFTTKHKNGSLVGRDEIVLSFHFDDYPQDIYWALVTHKAVPNWSNERIDQSRTILGAGPEDEYDERIYRNRVYNISIPIPHDVKDTTFEFSLVDMKRDGLCCDYGSGSYSLFHKDRLLVSSSAQNIHRETRTFTL